MIIPTGKFQVMAPTTPTGRHDDDLGARFGPVDKLTVQAAAFSAHHSRFHGGEDSPRDSDNGFLAQRH